MKFEPLFFALLVPASPAALPQRTWPVPSPPSTVDEALPGAGYSVASAGDVNGDGYGDVIIGSREHSGGAQVHLGSAVGLQRLPAWQLGGDATSAWFGSAVACAGDVNGDGYSDLLVGERSFETAEHGVGRATLYLGSAAGPSPTPQWIAGGDPQCVSFGRALAGAGDVNGDGFDDVLVGCPRFDGAALAGGRVQLYVGSAAGLVAVPEWSIDGAQVGEALGSAVAAAGDVNGDGYGDVLIGAERHDATQIDAGRALLFLGSATGLATSPAWLADGDRSDARFGLSLAGAGDLDGDGFADIAVAALQAAAMPVGAGRVAVFLGSPAGPSLAPDWMLDGAQAQGRLGWSLSGAGDVNGDGLDDLVVSSPWFDAAQRDIGRVQVYLGSPAGPVTDAVWTEHGDRERALLGLSVSAAGDVDGDGQADVIVASAGGRSGELAGGRVSLFRGIPPGPDPVPAWSVECDQGEAWFGSAVADAGDVNGDGFRDVIVGAWEYRNADDLEVGRAYLYPGTPSGPSASPTWIAEGDMVNCALGRSLAGAGDVNGDGFDDVIVGAPSRWQSEVSIGRVYVYQGSPSGLSLEPDWSVDGNGHVLGFGNPVAGVGDVNGDGFDDVAIGYPTVGGDVFVHLGSAQGLSLDPIRLMAGNQVRFGSSVAGAGDVDGDGFDDVLVSDPSGNGGHVYLYRGSLAGTEPDWSWRASGPWLWQQKVASAGDVNADGYADVLYSQGGSGAGQVYVHLGSASGPSDSPVWSVVGDHPRSRLGSSLSAGDIDADGYSDLVVGAEGYNDYGPENLAGWVYVYRGSPVGPSLTPTWARQDDDEMALFGSAVAAMDVNGDGHDDLLVGARGNAPRGFAGKAFCFLTEIAGGIAGLHTGHVVRR